jgi:hypothetical protein
VYRKSQHVADSHPEVEPHERPHETPKLTDQYIALLLLLLTNAGLMDVGEIFSQAGTVVDLSPFSQGLDRNAGRIHIWLQPLPKGDVADGRGPTNGKQGAAPVTSCENTGQLLSYDG